MAGLMPTTTLKAGVGTGTYSKPSYWRRTYQLPVVSYPFKLFYTRPTDGQLWPRGYRP